jgi:hypothetical protein
MRVRNGQVDDHIHIPVGQGPSTDLARVLTCSARACAAATSRSATALTSSPLNRGAKRRQLVELLPQPTMPIPRSAICRPLEWPGSCDRPRARRAWPRPPHRRQGAGRSRPPAHSRPLPASEKRLPSAGSCERSRPTTDHAPAFHQAPWVAERRSPSGIAPTVTGAKTPCTMWQGSLQVPRRSRRAELQPGQASFLLGVQVAQQARGAPLRWHGVPLLVRGWEGRPEDPLGGALALSSLSWTTGLPLLRLGHPRHDGPGLSLRRL